MSSLDPFHMIGKTLAGHFLVQSLVGEGRSSIVYRGLHIGPKKAVALKCYKLGSWLDAARAETFLRRFREESRASSQVAKELPQFVRSIGSGMTTNDEAVYIPYTVLEWLDGRSLARELSERSQRGEAVRPLNDLLVRLEPAVKALAHAHVQDRKDQTIVHGDISLGSFFLLNQGPTSGGAGDVRGIKLLDLGVAKVMRDLTREIAPQGSSDTIFSPAHAAPEQFDAKLGEWSSATDVYALALVLLEAMRGRALPAPQDGKDFAGLALNPKERPTPRALGLAVFDSVESVFAKALAVSPSERWRSAGEFWSELESAVRSEEPTRRRLPDEDLGGEDEPDGIDIPSTEPRPAVTPSGAVAVVQAEAAREKPTTDDTSPNGVLIDLTAIPSTGSSGSAPSTAAAKPPSPPVPPLRPAAGAAGSSPSPLAAKPGAPTSSGALPAVPAPPISSPSSGPSSGSGGLFKIPSPMPNAPTPKRVHTPVPAPSPFRSPPTPPSPSTAPPDAGARVSQPHGVPRPPAALRSFPPTPAKSLRSDVPPPKAPLVSTASASSPSTAANITLTPRAKPEPVEVRRDTPTLPLEAVHEKPVAVPPPVETKATKEPSVVSKGAESESRPAPDAPDVARVVREMAPPPKANVTVGDLPSVMVDDPESRKEKEQRHRETVRLAMPPPSADAPWDPASVNSVAIAGAEDSEVVFPPRTSRRLRGLWGVAIVSFIVVFLLGVVILTLYHFSTEPT